MASLREMLSGGSGQSSVTTLEEAQRQSGQLQAPTSPMQAAVLGADPNAAKMAGTKAQKTPALQAAINNTDSLQRAQTLQSNRTQATSGEQAEIAKATDAQQLGSLQSRVQQLAQQQLQTGVQNATQNTNLGPLATNQSANVQSALSTLTTNPNDQNALATLSTSLGHQVTQDDITALLGGNQGVAGVGGAAVAAGVNPNLTGGQLPPDLQKQATSLLGHDVSGMTMDQLIQGINSEIESQYNQVGQLQSRLNDPSTGAAERAEIRGQLQDLGAVGITASESAVDKLADGLQKAETIHFNGQDVPLDQLLSSDYVSGLVSSYLQDPTGDFAKQLKTQEPDLAKMIDQYKPALEAAVGGLGAGVPQFAQTQLNNQKLSKIDLGNGQSAQLSDDIMKQLTPNWGQFNGQAIDPNSSGVLGYLQNTGSSSANKSAVVSNLNALAAANPQFVSDIANWSQADVQKYLVNDKDRVGALVNQYTAVKGIDPNSPSSSNQIAQALGFNDATDMQSQVAEATTRNKSGLFDKSTNIASSGIVADANGNVNWNATLQNLQKATPQDLAHLITPGAQALSTLAGSNVRDLVGQGSGDLYNKMSSFLAAPVTDASRATLVNGMSMDDISKLAGTAGWAKLDPSTQSILMAKYQPAINNKIDNYITSGTGGQFKSLSNALQALQKPAADAQSMHGVEDGLKSTITKLQDLSRAQRADGAVLSEKAFDSTINSLQNQLQNYENASNKSFGDKYDKVQADVGNQVKQLTGYGSLSALLSGMQQQKLSNSDLSSVNKLVSTLQDSSRKARAAGDSLTETNYDNLWKQLQLAANGYKAPTGSTQGIFTSGPGGAVTNAVTAAENPGKALKTQGQQTLNQAKNTAGSGVSTPNPINTVEKVGNLAKKIRGGL